MSKHTPGPWLNWNGNPWMINSECGKRIARFYINDMPYEESVENANLAKKAPEMYDLIMKLSRCVVYGEGGTIEVRDWGGLEAVLQAGNAIYQEVEES